MKDILLFIVISIPFTPQDTAITLLPPLGQSSVAKSFSRCLKKKWWWCSTQRVDRVAFRFTEYVVIVCWSSGVESQYKVGRLGNAVEKLLDSPLFLVQDGNYLKSFLEAMEHLLLSVMTDLVITLFRFREDGSFSISAAFGREVGLQSSFEVILWFSQLADTVGYSSGNDIKVGLSLCYLSGL